MYLLNVCQNPDILRVIYFIEKILDIVFIIIPIGLIVFLTIDIYKMVISGEEKTIKQNQKMIINRIIFAILLFFVPTIVSFTMNLLTNVGFNVDYMDCLNNANTEFIENRTIELALNALEDAEQNLNYQTLQEAKSTIDKIRNKSIKNSYKDELTLLEEEYKKLVEEENNNNSDNDDNDNKDNSAQNNNNENNSSKDSNDNGSNKNNNGFTNYGKKGTEGTYFAPIQNVNNIKYGSLSTTSGCSSGNTKVYHDISGIKEGTKVYAGMDGTAEFYQKYCSANNQLYSYGNMVKITSSDGTYIVYAHLDSFPNNVRANSSNKTYITATCPKNGNNAPCTYNSCNGSIKTNTIATLQVKKGDEIGYVGNTGNSTGTHLHVEIHPYGSKECVENPWKAFGMK